MQSLEPFDQLAVDAFCAALEVCEEENVDLPEEVWAIAQSPEDHIEELGAIAKQHPRLNTAYRTARKVLRTAESTRKKRLVTEDTFIKNLDSPWEQPPEKQSFVPSASTSDNTASSSNPRGQNKLEQNNNASSTES